MVRSPALTLLGVLLTLSVAVGQETKDAHYWAKEGYKYQQKNDLFEAERCYKKSLELKPDDANVHANLTIVYIGAKKYADVVKSADQAIRLGAKLTGVYLNRAEGLRRLAVAEKDNAKQKEFYEKAIVDCEKVLDHKKHDLKLTDKREPAYAHAVLSVCHKALGNEAEAKKHHDKAIELDPKLKDQ